LQRSFSNIKKELLTNGTPYLFDFCLTTSKTAFMPFFAKH
jgi:hypothetical protein